MNKPNFDREMQKIISENKKAGVTPSLLLHACCAPCASACIERVQEYFDVTVYYYNPNIDDEREYHKRAAELERLCGFFGVKLFGEPFGAGEFYKAAAGLEEQPEGGKRCEKCFYLRLKKTAEKAKAENFDYFSTTLTLSPLKNSELINNIGNAAGKECGVKFLPSDFKKRGGFLRSVQLCERLSLYRQNYCGCAFSRGKNPTGETV